MISIPNDEWKEYYATLKENYIKSVLIKKHFNLQLTDSLVTLKQYSSQISLLISSEFMRIHQLLFPLKSLKNNWFSDDFRGNSSQLIHLNSLNLRSIIFIRECSTELASLNILQISLKNNCRIL